MKASIDSAVETAKRGTRATDEGESQVVTVALPEMSSSSGSYTGYNAEINVMALTHPYIRLGALVTELEMWTGTPTRLVAHLSTVLRSVSHLGARSFFGRSKRFGTHSDTGDEIFCDLGGENVRQLLMRLNTALLAAKGEGTSSRSAKRHAGNDKGTADEDEQGQSDQSLSIAKILAELVDFINSEDFLSKECYTQAQFENKYHLTWSASK